MFSRLGKRFSIVALCLLPSCKSLFHWSGSAEGDTQIGDSIPSAPANPGPGAERIGALQLPASVEAIVADAEGVAAEGEIPPEAVPTAWAPVVAEERLTAQANLYARVIWKLAALPLTSENLTQIRGLAAAVERLTRRFDAPGPVTIPGLP